MIISPDEPILELNARLVELATGEISTSSLSRLLDGVFARPDVARERSERFLSEPATKRGRTAHDGTPLGKSAISDREGEKVTCNVYADLVQVRQKAGRVGQDDEEREWKEPGEPDSKRGVITGYSRRSRKRFMNELARLRDVSDGFFVTLTFPDSVVAAFEAVEDMATWAKRSLEILLKRFLRAFPLAGGWWRLEFQDRKSGDFEGQYVPHFHLLLVGLRGAGLDYVKRFFMFAWAEVVGIEDEPDFYQHGTNAWRVNNRRHAMAYVSKYAAKETTDDFQAGRRWGSFGSLDLSSVLEVELTPHELVELKRYQRALLRSRGARGRKYAAKLAKLPAAFGASVLGMGDLSNGWHGNEPTIFKMLRAIGVEGVGDVQIFTSHSQDEPAQVV